MDLKQLLNDIEGKEKVKPEWINFSNSIKNIEFENFLRNSVIGHTMFFNDSVINKQQYTLIEKYISLDILEKISKISKIGNPFTFNVNGLLLNGNIIHHLYHLVRYKKTTNKFLGNNIIEWGGVYGNMASIISLIKDIDNYTIIDLPELLIIQYQFLSKIFGEENVGVVKEKNYDKKKINLVSLSNIKNIDYSIFDTFISNWSISESDVFYHEFCDKNKMFDMDNILISYHQCGTHIPFMLESTNINNILKNKKNIIIESVDIVPGVNFYAFK